MSGAFFAFIAVILCGIGARDHMLIHNLIRITGRTSLILTIGIGCAVGCSIVAAAAAAELIPHMPIGGRHMMALLATGWAGIEALVLSPRKPPNEPSQSLGALSLVLITSQITDVARMLVFAIAVSSGAALPAGAGGAFGACVSMALAAITADLLPPQTIAKLRRVMGLALLTIAIVLAWQAFTSR